MKKIMLAATAICALAAFAMPASASAVHHFTDDTAAIGAGGVNITLHGEMEWGVLFFGFACEYTVNVTVTTHDAHVTSFTSNTEGCIGSGLLEGCELEDDEATITDEELSPTNPVTASIVAGTAITISHPESKLEFHTTFDEECGFEEITQTFDQLKGDPELKNGYLIGYSFDPEDPENVGLFDAGAFELEMTTGGSLTVTPEEEETISIVDVP